MGGLFYDDDYGYLRLWVVLTIFFTAIIAVIAAIIVAICFFVSRYDHRMCDRKSAAMSRPTKFVRYGFMSWDCLIRDRDGHWTSIDNIRVVNGG